MKFEDKKKHDKHTNNNHNLSLLWAGQSRSPNENSHFLLYTLWREKISWGAFLVICLEKSFYSYVIIRLIVDGIIIMLSLFAWICLKTSSYNFKFRPTKVVIFVHVFKTWFPAQNTAWSFSSASLRLFYAKITKWIFLWIFVWAHKLFNIFCEWNLMVNFFATLSTRQSVLWLKKKEASNAVFCNVEVVKFFEKSSNAPDFCWRIL